VTPGLARSCWRSGFGEWSIKYILVRGFVRLDALPLEDVGLRLVIGYYFPRGQTLTPAQMERPLSVCANLFVDWLPIISPCTGRYVAANNVDSTVRIRRSDWRIRLSRG
jgi:3-methyladenine DNA glycosylase/8-oxoguanine DNA glycosylase